MEPSGSAMDPSRSRSIKSFARSMQQIRKDRDRSRARKMHVSLYECGLDSHPSLGNYLVSLLVDVGCMIEAQQVFDRIPHQNRWSCSSLMSGYVKQGNPTLALILSDKAQGDDEDDDDADLLRKALPLLKACAKLKDVDRGIGVHARVARLGLLRKDLFIGSALVDMYAQAGLLRRAYEAFESLAEKDVVSWTSMVMGYAEHGSGEEALECFERMQLEAVSPDSVTFTCCLKACGSIRDARKGGDLHARIAKGTGLSEQDLVVGTALVDMYAKAGCLRKAQRLFDELAVRDVVAWNALIGGYAEHGKGEEALDCFEAMQMTEGLPPDAVTFACGLKACGLAKAIERGYGMHGEIEKKGLLLLSSSSSREGEGNAMGNALLDMYAKCGCLDMARRVFEMLPIRDVIAWTSLIAGYAEYGNSHKEEEEEEGEDEGEDEGGEEEEEALVWFERMQSAGVPLNAATYVSVLKACGNAQAAERGRELHGEIERKGLLECDAIVGNALIDMYAKCGLLGMAQEAFDKLQVRDVVSWSTLISAYAEHGHDREALERYRQMQSDGVAPNAVTFVGCLKACGSLGAAARGQEIHAEVERRGLRESNLPALGNALMDMYAKCGALALVEQVFGSLVGNRDVVSWTTLVSAYADHGHGRRAVGCLEQMRRDGICPNAATYVCALKACASFCTGISTGIWAVEKVAEMHAEIGRDGLLEREPVLGNALIDAYVKLGSLSGAQAVFDKLRSRDVVSWTSLVAGYAEHGRGDEALQRLEQMKGDGVLPNAVTFACALKACCDTGAAEKGRELHGEIETKGWLLTDGVVGNALVDMYGRCGSLATAQQVFDELPSRDAAACNSLIAGYAQAGESEAALHVFESRMPREQIAPDSITFVVVLNACSRAGLSGRCETYFTSMARDFGIAPSLEHHAGLVDLLCRAGRLDDAVSLVRKMPFSPNLVVWNTVLGACRYSGNVELGRRAFECSLRKLHRT